MSFILHNDSWGWDWRFSTVWSKAARSPCCWLSTLSVDYAMALYPFIVVPLSLTVSGLGSPKPLHISEMWGESCSGFLGKEKRLFLLSFSFSFFSLLSFSTWTTYSLDSAGSLLVAVRMATLRAARTQGRGEKNRTEKQSRSPGQTTSGAEPPVSWQKVAMMFAASKPGP